MLCYNADVLFIESGEEMSDKAENRISFTQKLVDGLVLFLSVIIIGALCGVIGTAFIKSISFVTHMREKNDFFIFLLPFGGLVSAGIYKLTKMEKVGTGRALQSARGEEQTPVILVPAIFIASVITHCFGGSAGKEGAALQLGSGAAEIVSKITKADKERRSVLTVCGMAALFSAVFGTPAGACVFAAEVAFAGAVNVSAAIPAFASSVIAFLVSTALGVAPERFHISLVPEFGAVVLLRTLAAAAAVALVSAAFCHILHKSKSFAEKVCKNPFLRIFAGGCIVIILTLAFGKDYNGGGMSVIERVFETDTVRPEAFLLKIIFTAVTIAAGFKGGEIVPSLFIGSTLGGFLSQFLGLPCGYGAAVGMIAFFSGVTNCPLASAVIAVELFGTDGFLLFAASAFVARAVSGKISLYEETKTLK